MSFLNFEYAYRNTIKRIFFKFYCFIDFYNNFLLYDKKLYYLFCFFSFCVNIILGDNMKRVFYVLCMIVCLLCNISVNALPNSYSNIQRVKYIPNTSSFANGHTTTAVFSANSSLVFCSLIQADEPLGRTCTKIDDYNNGWSLPMRAAIGKMIEQVDGSDESYYYFDIAFNNFIYNKGEGSKDNISSEEGNQSLYYKYMNIAEQTYNQVKNFTVNPSIVSNHKFVYSNGVYTVSDISVLDCPNCTVSATKGTVVKTGNNNYSLNISADVLEAGKVNDIKFSVTAKDSMSFNGARNYSCGANVQTITPLETEVQTKTVTKTDSVTFNIDRSKITVNKVDSNGKPLSGAGLTLTKDGNNLANFNDATKTFTDLESGKYCVVENEAPEGYFIGENNKCVTLNNNNLSESITLTNSKTSIKIKKIDIDSKEALSGAKLEIINKDGEVVKTIDDFECSWTTTDDYITIEGLPIGTYYIKEVEAPSGYVLLKNPVEFTINKDGTVTTSKKENLSDDSIIVVANELTKFYISKQDATTGKELPGATLQIIDSDGNVIEEWVSSSEPHYVEGLPVGNYKLKEIIAPEGYQKTEQMVDFSVKADGSTKNVVMTNEVVSVNVPNTMRNVSVFMYIFGFTLVIVSTVVLLYKENKLPKRLTNIFKRK